MNFCDACGRPLKGGCGMGGSLLCRTCEPDISAEINRLHELGKPINAMAIARQYFRDHHSAGAYTLRDIPRDLKIRAQHQALDERITLKELIFKALEYYLKQAKGN